ncbi:MAG: hypothetical protein CMG67_01615 [Candidatus Marinimicrobia bacterium]|nr:hypothetical protein [Candidatus Neomarinimicrobiota bacterium]|tara:strand:+ start:15420 stop:15662 length:243 start_codon:yes stop_codon:yes gene_type:complete
MNNSQKIIKMISDFIEAGLISSQDFKRELSTSLKFQKENIASKLDLVTKEEFKVLKKLIEKQQVQINRLKKNKSKKVKKS